MRLTPIIFSLLLSPFLLGADGKKKGKKSKPKDGMPELPEDVNLEEMSNMMFDMMDTNKDGKLSREEVKKMGQKVVKEKGDTEDEIDDQGENIFQQLDKNGDGKITRKEAQTLFENANDFFMYAKDEL